MHYTGTYCDLRLVEPSDAKIILEFRLNIKLNKFLSQTKSDLKAQESWIMKYKEREKNGTEYYFLVIDKNGIPCGTIRIYNIDYSENRFTIGSWIIRENSDPRISIESLLAAEKYAYCQLGLIYNYFDVRKGNKSVVRFHKNRGANLIGEDDLNYYFIFNKSSFEKYLDSISRIVGIKDFLL